MAGIRTFPSFKLCSPTCLFTLGCCALLILILTSIERAGQAAVYTTKKINTVEDVVKSPEFQNSKVSKIDEAFTERMNFPVERVRYDNRRILQIYEHVRTGKEWLSLTDRFDVCLATQTSIERLYWLPQVLEHWDAPLSIVIFISNEREWLIFNLYSLFLERCYPKFSSSVSVQIAVPNVVSTKSFSNFWTSGSYAHFNIRNLVEIGKTKNCGDFETAKKHLQEIVSLFALPTEEEADAVAKKIVYPQNHLRNIARKTCITPWTYSVDVDIIPSFGIAHKLQGFYEEWKSDSNHCKKCAFVVPTFELEASSFPQAKMEIINHFRNKSALPLNAFYPPAQQATDYQRWINSNGLETKAQISHNVILNKTKFYEPFYVSSDTIPAFDERFMGYGLTRSSQFQEALLAGWSFSVLTPVFNIHWGIHRPSFTQESGFDPKKASVAEIIREQQTSHNRDLFEKILKEMKLKQAEGIF